MQSLRRTLPIAGAFALVSTAIFAGSASAGSLARTCHGLPVTVAASTGVVRGTSGSDIIALTGPARVSAGAGRDIICGSRGADVINGGPGDDVILGRGGNDILRAGPGNDMLYGEAGADRLDGGTGRDVSAGGSGRNKVVRAAGQISGANQMIDTVVAGNHSISLVMNTNTLQTLMMSDMSIGSSWQPTLMAQSVAWASITFPLMNNMIAITPDQLTYQSAVSELVPGEQVVPNQMLAVPNGSTTVITAPGVMELQPGSGTGYSILNLGQTSPAVGLAQSGTVNGQRTSQMPTTAQQLFPGMIAALTAPTTIRLVAQQQWGDVPGTVLFRLPPNAFVGTFGTKEVLDVSFDINNGWQQG